MARRKRNSGFLHNLIQLFKALVFFVFFMFILGCAGFGVLVYITPPPPTPPVMPAAPTTSAVTAALIDGNTGDLIAGKEPELRTYPASTTKMLTCILALEEGQKLLDKDAKITSRAMAQEGTLLYLSPAEPISLHQLLYGMMLVSGNDAAVAVAETVGGSYDRFVEMMNEKAASIGISHSHFANPSGLTSKEHYSTAADMAQVARYAMKNQDFRKIVREISYPMTYRDGTVRTVENRNEFLSSGYKGANGVKTGMTEAAGDCLVASAERDGQLMIVSLFNDEKRWEDTKVWLDYGFTCVALWDNYEKELAAEPIVYRFINQLTGKEPKWQEEKIRAY